MTGPEVCWCNHPRSYHTERLRGCPELCCPLPCECLGFELRAAPAPVDAATPGEVYLRADPDANDAGTVVDAGPDELLSRAHDAIRQFGPGTSAGGRAEAGWLPAGRIVGDGPEILRRSPEAAVNDWDPGRVLRSRFP